MTLNDVALIAKKFLREGTSDTIVTADMEDFCAKTYRDWCEDAQWPEATWNDNTVAETQEYGLPLDLNTIFRVYVNGQRIPAITIPLLEGDVQQNYDPTWRVLPSISVPAMTSGTGLAIPITAGPGFAKMQYYLRGGFIGFVPKPAAIYPISIEGSSIPQTVASSDVLVFPNQYNDGIAWGGVYRFLISDRRVDEAQGARQLENEAFQKAMRWRRRMGGYDQLPAFQPQDYRGFYNLRNRLRISQR